MNVSEQRVRAGTLRALHRGPRILVLPNAWDCVSARLFEQTGFPAIATTSGGISASISDVIVLTTARVTSPVAGRTFPGFAPHPEVDSRR